MPHPHRGRQINRGKQHFSPHNSRSRGTAPARNHPGSSTLEHTEQEQEGTSDYSPTRHGCVSAGGDTAREDPTPPTLNTLKTPKRPKKGQGKGRKATPEQTGQEPSVTSESSPARHILNRGEATQVAEPELETPRTPKAPKTPKKGKGRNRKATPKKKKKYTPRKSPRRAVCGRCKRHKNHTSRSPTQNQGDAGEWDDIPSVNSSLICTCDMLDKKKVRERRNEWVEGEDPDLDPVDW